MSRSIPLDLKQAADALLEDSSTSEEWIGVDLDGTLAKYNGWKGATKIGEPIPKMVSRVRRWVGHGKKVKIFTARADDERSVNAIKKWLKTHELPDLEVTNLKDEHMTKLWDDRAVSVEKNTGEVKETLSAVAFDLLVEQLLDESPEIKTLKDNAIPLEPDERAQVMKAGAVWHHGRNGEATPAVRKAVVNGKTWYWCATHRAGRVKSTLKGAINAFEFVKTTS